jgi:hypothetical protein
MVPPGRHQTISFRIYFLARQAVGGARRQRLFSSGEQIRAILCEPQIRPALVHDEPALLDRAIEAGLVFSRRAFQSNRNGPFLMRSQKLFRERKVIASRQIAGAQ